MVRAMLVEDNDGFRESLMKVLSSKYPDVQLTEAVNGKEAIRKSNLFPPDLVFMDIHLPDRNGLELARMIKTRHPKATIIILSNYDLTEYREAAYRCGASHFVSKDSPMGDFLSLIESVIHILPPA